MSANTSSIQNPKSKRDERVPLVAAAATIGMSPNGLFHILKKTNSAIRDDGRWYCTIETMERIKRARSDLKAPHRPITSAFEGERASA
jgi:hypothetical protein